MHDDMIDFPCSPTFVAGLAEMGMTQDYPPEFYARERSGQSNAKSADTEKLIKQLSGRLTYLEHRFYKRTERGKNRRYASYD